MPITHQHLEVYAPAIAEKLRDHYPHAGAGAVAEYLEALRAYELAPTPATLDRVISTAQRLKTRTIDIGSISKSRSQSIHHKQ